MRNADVKLLGAFEMRTWRRIEKISWSAHKTNEMLETIGEERKSPDAHN